MSEQTAMTGEQLNDLRRRVVDGEEVSEAELRSAISYLHEIRGGEVQQSKSAKKKVSREEAQRALDNLGV